MKYKTIKFCSLLILLSFCNITKAQQFLKLKGKVLDEKKRPISFCHITLKDKPSKGVISTYGGYFVIEMMSTDTLEISSVGYEKTILHSKFDVDSITIILKKDVLDLPEFTIKYNKKLTPQKIIKQTLKKWNKAKKFLLKKKQQLY